MVSNILIYGPCLMHHTPPTPELIKRKDLIKTLEKLIKTIQVVLGLHEG